MVPGFWILGRCSFRLVASLPRRLYALCRLSESALICGGKIVIIFWRALPPVRVVSPTLTLSHAACLCPCPRVFLLYFYFSTLFLFFHFVFFYLNAHDEKQSLGWAAACLLVVLWYLIRICVAFICMTPPNPPPQQLHLPPTPRTLLHSKGISIYHSLKFHGWLSLSLSLYFARFLALWQQLAQLALNSRQKLRLKTACW